MRKQRKKIFKNRSVDYTTHLNHEDEQMINKEIDNLKIKYKMKKRGNSMLPNPLECK